MVRPTMWRVLALAAAMGAGFAAPAMAQIVIGEQSSPSVVVDWSVLDNLGQQPSLADMVRGRPVQAPAAAAATAAGKKPVAYAPYQPGKKGAAAAPQQGKFVPYQPGAKQPVAATPGYQPGKFVPYQPDAKKTPTAKAPAVKPVAAKTTAPAKAKPIAAEPVAVASGLDAIKAEVKRAETAVPTPAPVAAAPAVTPAPAPAKMPEAAALKAVEDAVKTETPRAVPAPVTPAPLAETAKPVEVKPVAPAVIASAAPSVALPSILTPPPAVAVEPAQDAPAAPAVSHGGGDTLTILFAGDSSGVPDSVRGDLDRLAQRMMKKETLGLQLLAYADGDDSNASKARRLSLSRALEVRKYLMDQGVRSTRIEVRALGNKTEGNGPADRVEAVLVGK